MASSIMVGDGETSYPVDYMTEKTSCELHVGVSNLSMKVVEGYVLAADSTALWLGNAIPHGYALVGVDLLVLFLSIFFRGVHDGWYQSATRRWRVST